MIRGRARPPRHTVVTAVDGEAFADLWLSRIEAAFS